MNFKKLKDGKAVKLDEKARRALWLPPLDELLCDGSGEVYAVIKKAADGVPTVKYINGDYIPFIGTEEVQAVLTVTAGGNSAAWEMDPEEGWIISCED